MRLFKGFPHILESQQFETEDLMRIFERAEEMRSNPGLNVERVLEGKRVLIGFGQPSSRTRLSFEMAAKRLGASDVTVLENMSEFSSMAKGETIEDTIELFRLMGFDLVILRTPKEGEVARAAAAAGPSLPVINAGDGKGQHPTQGLLDVYTIWRHFRDLNRRLTIAIVGDLTGRTARSLAYIMAKFPRVSFKFVSPATHRMGRDILTHLLELGIEYREVGDLDFPGLLEEADVGYMMRPQTEYAKTKEEKERLIEEYSPLIMTPERANRMKREAIIMHPLPRNFELPIEVDSNHRAVYIPQMENGLWTRMVELEMIANNF